MTHLHHSRDSREQLLDAIDAGLPEAEAVQYFGVSRRTFRRWRKLRRDTGSPAPASRPGKRSRVTARHQQVIRDLVAANPDLTQPQLCAALAEQTGLQISVPTMSRQLRLLKITRKKRL